MIDTTYAVNCLKQGFQRYIRYNKINATIDCGDNYVSFYVKGVNGKQYLARGSNHHLKMQHLADKDEPWNGDNISVVFITPSSPQDTRIRGRVRQNHYGGIKPFSVTTYQYDNTILDESDLRQIFYAITVFLNGKGYIDPFAKTPKAAKVIPRNANIKPYKEPSPARNISVDKDGNYVSANAWGADYVSENKQYKTNTNMNKKLIRLTESDLHKIVKESVNKVLNEAFGDGMIKRELNKKLKQLESNGTLGKLFDELYRCPPTNYYATFDTYDPKECGFVFDFYDGSCGYITLGGVHGFSHDHISSDAYVEFLKAARKLIPIIQKTIDNS